MHTFSPGDTVLRKSDAKKQIAVGIVRGTYSDGTVAVEWPAPTRIGGSGWHRSVISSRAIVAATDAEIAARRATIAAIRAEAKRRDLIERPWLCRGSCRRILRPCDLVDGGCRWCGGAVVAREVAS